VQEIGHRIGIAGPQQQAMNSFTLGRLAEIHIQSLVDGVGQGRTTRRATSQRRKHHFHWNKKSVKTTSRRRAMK
jgi:hypothetical protein